MNQLKKTEKQRNNFFQSSISTLPGPSITIRNDQIQYTPQTAQQVEQKRSRHKSHAGTSQMSRSTIGDTDMQSVLSGGTRPEDLKFKNNIPNLYNGKYSPQNVPQMFLQKKKKK